MLFTPAETSNMSASVPSEAILNIYPDEYEPVARLSPLGGGEYSLSFHKHTGRWEPAQDLVNILVPYLQSWDFTDRKSGLGH